MECTIDRFEETNAVLELENGDTIIIPRSELPDEAQEGDVIDVAFTVHGRVTDERATQARAILNELLGSDDPKA